MTQTPTSKPRLKDIANLANISIATVSMALADHPRVNDDTKRRVREIGKQIGYRIKPKASIAEPRRVGLMIIGGSGENAVNAPLMLNLSQAGYAHKTRFELAATSLDLTPAQHLERTLQFARDLDGLMLVNMVTTDLLDALRKQQISTLVIGDIHGSFVSPPSASIVSFDTVAMGYQAAMFLLEQGHEHIGFVTEYMPPGLSHDRWYRGYCLALIEKGIAPRSQFKFIGDRKQGVTPAVGAMTKLRKQPTAFIVPDTREAVNLALALKDAGRPLAPNNILYHSINKDAPPVELTRQPFIFSNLTDLSEQAISRLMAVSPHEMLPPGRVLIPHVFHTYNA